MLAILGIDGGLQPVCHQNDTETCKSCHGTSVTQDTAEEVNNSCPKRFSFNFLLKVHHETLELYSLRSLRVCNLNVGLLRVTASTFIVTRLIHLLLVLSVRNVSGMRRMRLSKSAPAHIFSE